MEVTADSQRKEPAAAPLPPAYPKVGHKPGRKRPWPAPRRLVIFTLLPERHMVGSVTPTRSLLPRTLISSIKFNYVISTKTFM